MAVVSEVTYILQSSEYAYGRWSSWSCCSPQYSTLDEAREHYDACRECRYIHERVRLARVTTRWAKIPGVRCCYNAGSRRRVYAAKRLRCCCPPTREDLVPISEQMEVVA